MNARTRTTAPVADAGIGPLADNGGQTPTHALLPGSPAIDTAVDADCPATDQRHRERPVDGDHDGVARCDVGAFELAPDTIAVPALGPAALASLILFLLLSGLATLRGGPVASAFLASGTVGCANPALGDASQNFFLACPALGEPEEWYSCANPALGRTRESVSVCQPGTRAHQRKRFRVPTRHSGTGPEKFGRVPGAREGVPRKSGRVAGAWEDLPGKLGRVAGAQEGGPRKFRRVAGAREGGPGKFGRVTFRRP